jgi:uncharacterized protein YrrD
MLPGERDKNREDAMPHTLVPSDRVEHANVYGRDGAKLGTIERLMLDKASGTVAYAVIKSGGLLASHPCGGTPSGSIPRVKPSWSS